MPAASSLAPLIPVAVFLLSGLAKARDRGSRISVVQQLRLPTLLQRRWLALALPAGEVVVALLLLAP